MKLKFPQIIAKPSEMSVYPSYEILTTLIDKFTIHNTFFIDVCLVLSK